MSGVILGIIYSCKREHLSGVVIRTLQASCLKPQAFRTHFRTLDAKNIYISKRQQRPRLKARDTPRPSRWFYLQTGPYTGREVQERPGPAPCCCWRPAEASSAHCQAPSCENRMVVCAAKKRKKAQLLGPLQNQLGLPLTFTSAFWP